MAFIIILPFSSDCYKKLKTNAIILEKQEEVDVFTIQPSAQIRHLILRSVTARMNADPFTDALL